MTLRWISEVPPHDRLGARVEELAWHRAGGERMVAVLQAAVRTEEPEREVLQSLVEGIATSFPPLKTATSGASCLPAPTCARPPPRPTRVTSSPPGPWTCS
jgi:hypothetical protein